MYYFREHVLQWVEEVLSGKKSEIGEPMTYPQIVSRDEWLVARNALLITEKEATHARDRLNAERRRLPMVKIDKAYFFEGPEGKVRLLDLFDKGGNCRQGKQRLLACTAGISPAWGGGVELAHRCCACEDPPAAILRSR